MKRKQYYGLSADAAAIRTAMDLRLQADKVNGYKAFLFQLFNLKGEGSYEKLHTVLKEADSVEYLIETIADQKDAEEFFNFTLSFLGRSQNKEKEESEAKLQILNCELKSLIFSDSQQIQYIEIPDIPFEELKKDFEIAKHLEILKEIASDENALSKPLFICESKETGLLACKYISSIITEGYSFEESEAEINLEGKLFIVEAQELDQYFFSNSIDDSSISVNGPLGLQAVKNINMSVPWWVCYKELPVMILINKNTYLSNKFPDKFMTFLESRDNVIVLFVRNNDEEKNNTVQLRISNNGIANIIEDISFEMGYYAYNIPDPQITSEYMMKLMCQAIKNHGYIIKKDVDITAIIKKLKNSRANRWRGNTSIMHLVKKVISQKKKGDYILKQEDFAFVGTDLMIMNNTQEVKKQTIENKEAISRMNQCIFGLEPVKERFMEAVNELNVIKAREKYGLKANRINKVFAFYGPPGVGKTEMAQHFADIMFENDLLIGKKFCNISGAQLKAPYVGQTSLKVTALFENHDVLFFDEIYTLTAENDGCLDSFSQEALGQLCIELEKHSKNKLIIFAGYGGDVAPEDNKMKQFLESNPGISSRVTFHINFPSYCPDKEMPQIFSKIVQNDDYELEEGWEEICINFFKLRAKTRSYGNAREARKLFQLAKSVQSSRIVHQTLDLETLKLINCEDIKKAVSRILDSEITILDKPKFRIGF